MEEMQYDDIDVLTDVIIEALGKNALDLTTVETLVLKMRFGLLSNKQKEDVASILHLTNEKTKEIELEAMYKIIQNYMKK